ncbi:MAG TPA: hypothetical protein VF750_03900 [Sphingomicrobium sp.]
MGNGKHHIGITAIATVLLLGSGAASAREQGSLVLVPTSGAELAFVPPAAEARVDPTDEAIQNFSRLMSQAAVVQRQQIDASCRAGLPKGVTSEQRFTWAANCHYARR